MIFDESTLRKLNALTLVATRVRSGRMRGDRRSSKRGTSIEFADFRNYVPGDDLRRLDWNIYARLNKPFIRLYEDEEDLAVYVLLDVSLSMDWGEGDANKFTFARRLCAALGSISLNSGDAFTFLRLTNTPETPDHGAVFGPSRGAQNTLRFLTYLEGLRPTGSTALNRTLLDFGYKRRRPGLVFLISDLLDPGGYQAGLNHLLSRGHQVVLIHLLAPEEIEPSLQGDLKLIDVETGTDTEVTLDGAVLDGYRRQMDGWRAEIRSYCRSRGIHYIFTSSGSSWDGFVLRTLRREGVVK